MAISDDFKITSDRDIVYNVDMGSPATYGLDELYEFMQEESGRVKAWTADDRDYTTHRVYGLTPPDWKARLYARLRRWRVAERWISPDALSPADQMKPAAQQAFAKRAAMAGDE